MRIPATLLTQTCLIKPFEGATPSGPKYGTEFSAKCRFEEHRKKYVSALGKEYISAGRLFLLPDAEILALKPDSKITVDGVSYILSEKLPQRGFIDSHVECVVV